MGNDSQRLTVPPLSARRILVDGSLLSALLGSLIAGSIRYNPEIWREDYPPEIKDKAPPMSDAAKQQRLVITLPFLLALIGVPVRSNLAIQAQNDGKLSFATAFLNTYLIMQIFNLFDLIVLDYAWMIGVRPRFAILPGTEGLAAYDDIRYNALFHTKGFLIGTLMLPIPASLIAGLSVWLARRGQRNTDERLIR